MYAPLLKHRDWNPHATIIKLFVNPVDPIDPDATKSHRMRLLTSFLLANPEPIVSSGIIGIEPRSASELFHNFDDLFEKYAAKCGFREFSYETGLEMKMQNTIIDPWPWRHTNSTSRLGFDLILASGHTGGERYVEWKRGNYSH